MFEESSEQTNARSSVLEEKPAVMTTKEKHSNHARGA
jgi:hypothetical protein